jgi:hypothetical protein
VDTIPCSFSDHSFVAVALNLTPLKSTPVTIKTRSLNQYKLDLISEKLKQVPFHSMLTQEMDTSLKFFIIQRSILDVIDEIAPVKTKRMKNNNSPWFDKELKDMFLVRDRVHAYALSLTNDRNHQVWVTFRKIRNDCKSKYKKKMKLFFESKTTKDFTSSKDFWKFYNHFIKTKRSKCDNTISSIYDSSLDENVSAPIDIGNVFCKYFTNIEMPSDITEEQSKDYINKKFSDYKKSGTLITPTFSFTKIDESDVIKAINLLNSSSSCGNTLIPVSVIKIVRRF